MDLFAFLLYLIAFICFVLAALGVAARLNLVAVGLAAWVLVLLVRAGQAVF